MGFFNRKQPETEPERGDADDIRELRQAYAEITAPNTDAWAWFPTVFQIAFGLLSFFGTYIGLRDIISTGDMRAGVLGDAMVFGLVALATGAMIYFLRRAVADPWSLAGVGSMTAYAILAFFSVTFGFAFYWGQLEARQQAVSGATARLETMSDDINITAVGLRRAVEELSSLEEEFRRLAEVEQTVGGTCGDGSSAGFGPRTRHRTRRAEEIRSRVAQLTPRFQAVAPAVEALEAKMGEIVALSRQAADEVSDGARQTLFRETRQTARRAATEVNALTKDPLLVEVGATFQRWGQEYKTPGLVRRDDPKGASYVCYQVAAGDALISAGVQLSNLPKVSVPELPDYVGPAATREAVLRMQRTASEVFTGLWTALPFVDGGEQRFDDAETEAAYRAGVGAGLNGRAGGDGGGSGSASGGGGGGVGSDFEVVAANSGLLEKDRFPLLVAIIVDAMLFIFVLIDRPASQYFGRFQRKIRNAIEEKLDPMEMVALRRALNDDPNWALLRKFRFTIGDRIMLAQPLDLKRSKNPDAEAEIEMLQDLLALWRRNGLVKRQDLTSEEIREELRKAGDDELTDQYQEFRAYRFTDKAFEVILMRGLFVGASSPSERLYARARAELPPPPAQIEHSEGRENGAAQDRGPDLGPDRDSEAQLEPRESELERATRQAIAMTTGRTEPPVESDGHGRNGRLRAPQTGARRSPQLPSFLRNALRSESVGDDRGDK